MRKLFTGLLIAAALAPAAVHGGAMVDDCCACLAIPDATTQQIADPAGALFCVHAVGTTQFDAAVAHCEGFLGGYVVCVPKIDGPGQSCPVILLEDENIACPVTAGVPALGHPALAGLAVLLAGSAMIGLRRRQGRTSPSS